MEPTPDSPQLTHSTSSFALNGENTTPINRQELFKQRLQSPQCLLCGEKLLGAFVYKHYIECTKIFLKELQESFVPSSILSYCLHSDLLNLVYQSPEQLQQLTALITHLQTLQANIQNKGQPQKEQPPQSGATKVDDKKKKK